MREIRTAENLVASIADATAALIRSLGFRGALDEAMRQYESQLPTNDIRRKTIRGAVARELNLRSQNTKKKKSNSGEYFNIYSV